MNFRSLRRVALLLVILTALAATIAGGQTLPLTVTDHRVSGTAAAYAEGNPTKKDELPETFTAAGSRILSAEASYVTALTNNTASCSTALSWNHAKTKDTANVSFSVTGTATASGKQATFNDTSAWALAEHRYTFTTKVPMIFIIDIEAASGPAGWVKLLLQHMGGGNEHVFYLNQTDNDINFASQRRAYLLPPHSYSFRAILRTDTARPSTDPWSKATLGSMKYSIRIEPAAVSDRPVLSGVEVTAASGNDAPVFSGTVVGAPPNGVARLQALKTAGNLQEWEDIATQAVGADGMATFRRIRDYRAPFIGATHHFMRVAVDP